jgi:hypothetical protein
MRIRLRGENWNSEALKSVTAILEAANIQELKATIELFFPARACPCCNSGSFVFVRPQGLCVTCWRRFSLPFKASGPKAVLKLLGL